MSNSLANVAPKYRLRIVAGPDKGAEYQIISDKISIGRDQDNDIVLTDPKCSRKHITLYMAQTGIQIVNTSLQNAVSVDGIEVENALIEAGSKISLGNTKIEVLGLSPQIHSGTQISEDLDYASPSTPKNNKLVFYGIVAVVIATVAWLLSSNIKKEEVVPLDSQELADQRVETIREQENELIRAQQAKGINTQEYKEAQALYIQGFRDYREGNYTRSIDYFSGALSLFPNHELSQRYLKLAKTKQDELIQRTLLEANRYFEQKMYSKAMASYKNVMILINDQTNRVFIEAKERFNQCSLLVREGM